MVERRGGVDLGWRDGCCCGGLCLSLYLGGGEVRVFGVVEEMGGESGDVVVDLKFLIKSQLFWFVHVCMFAARKRVYSAAGWCVARDRLNSPAMYSTTHSYSTEKHIGCGFQSKKGMRTSLTTVLWSRRSGLGTQFLEFGGGFGGRRGGLAVK